MKYRRVLFVTELGHDARAEVATIRRVAPEADLLVVIAVLPGRTFAWLSGRAAGDRSEAATASLDDLRGATAGGAQTVEVKLAPELTVDDLAEIATASEIDLLAAGRLPLKSMSVVAELRKRRSLAVLSTAGAPAGDRPIKNILCVAPGERARAAVAEFLRDHGTPALHASVLLTEARLPGDLAGTLNVAGIEAAVDLITPWEASRRRWRGEEAPDADLLVLARFPGASLRSAPWPAPVLILPPPRAAGPALRRPIDLSDLVDECGVIRARFNYALGVGRREPIPDQQIAFVSAGRIIAEVATSDGDAELSPSPGVSSLGVYRMEGRTASDLVTAIEEQVEVIRPGSRPLLLFDADLAARGLAAIAGPGGPEAPDALAVRLRPMQSCKAIRARLRLAGLAARVVDASAVLDEGQAFDVPAAVDPVRLARVAVKLRAAGFPVAAIVYGGEHTPSTIGFAALRAEDLASTPLQFEPPAPGPPSLASRLEATTGAPLLAGNRIEVEMDNGKARRWLLDAIGTSKRRVHLQVYMALDDDVGVEVESALAAAGARGVAVRVVVDSLHGLHGSLGLRNPLLERLGNRPGVELRVLRPVTGAPSLEDLKQRDHRKVAIIDGALALVGGRNLSHEYYTGFEEVNLTPRSLWREVPWLDAGARVEGPAVAALERSFLQAWTEAGGSAFDIADIPECGPSPARVVVHLGLRDASTLESYLALIETAKSHVYAVNGFPLVLEIQHALLRALRRGVRVRALFGNLTPTHGGKRFEGPWGTARVAATELVSSRIDTLVAAGGECHQLAMPEQPGWTPGLGVLKPHVHAKVMSVDGRVCTVGSANLDVTAGYWENELMLIVEDPTIVRALETRIDQLTAGSARVDRDEPAWRQTARRRDWMRHWPGVLSV